MICIPQKTVCCFSDPKIISLNVPKSCTLKLNQCIGHYEYKCIQHTKHFFSDLGTRFGIHSKFQEFTVF